MRVTATVKVAVTYFIYSKIIQTMKKINLSAIAVLLLCAAYSCSKDKIAAPEPINIYWGGGQKNGAAKAQKNGKTWDASVECYTDSVNTIAALSFRTFSFDSLPREKIIINCIQLHTGKKKIIQLTSNCRDTFPTSMFILKGGDGDAVALLYNINEKEDNFLDVTAVDTVARVIEGNFQVSYKVLDPYKERPYGFPAVLTFKSGNFKAKLLK